MTQARKNTAVTDNFSAFEDGVFIYSKQGPVRKSPESGDTLRDTLETLYSEHRYISSLLDALDKQALRLKPGKVPDYHLLLDIVDYLMHYPAQYHHPREDLLFTSMLERDDKFQPRLDRLLREHETLHRYNQELFNELTLVAEGRPADRVQLFEAITRFVTGYRQHINYESRTIFPSAKGKLSEADLEKLSAKTRYIDDPLFGGEIQYQYKRLGRSLQARVETVSGELIAREMSGIESTIGRLSEWVDTLDRLKNAVSEQYRRAWREQLDTFKEHTEQGQGPGIGLLPLALFRNNRRQVAEGYSEVRNILGSGDAEETDASSSPEGKKRSSQKS